MPGLRVPVKVASDDPDQCSACEGTGLQQGCPYHSTLEFERYIRHEGCKECAKAGNCSVCFGTGRWLKKGEGHRLLNVEFHKNIVRRIVDGKRDGKDKVDSLTITLVQPCCRYVQSAIYQEFRMDWHSDRRWPGLVMEMHQDFIPGKKKGDGKFVDLPPVLVSHGMNARHDTWRYCPNCAAKVVLREMKPVVREERFKTKTETVEVPA